MACCFLHQFIFSVCVRFFIPGFYLIWSWDINLFNYMMQCDLLDMPAVGQLEKDAKYALVYQLLKIFLTQRLDAYLEFQAANSALLKSYGITIGLVNPSHWLLDELIFLQSFICQTLRVFCLFMFVLCYRSCSWRLYSEDAVDVVGGSCITWIWSNSICPHQRYSSGKLAHHSAFTRLVIVFILIRLFGASLQIDNDEVELWVVKALTTKLIDCKMDQLNQVVLVRYSFSPSTHTHTHTQTQRNMSLCPFIISGLQCL